MTTWRTIWNHGRRRLLAAAGPAGALLTWTRTRWRGLNRPWRQAVAGGAALTAMALLGLTVWLAGGGSPDKNRIFHTVTRMDLIVSVLEGGSIASTNSQEIKCDVEGQTTILSIVPDGTILTGADVKRGRVLVELDASALKEKEAQQSISFNDANAAFAQAKASYDIRLNQNESDIKGAELKRKFARMDLERYVGVDLAERLTTGKTSIDRILRDELRGKPDGVNAGATPALRGEALQTWRKLRSEIDLAKADAVRARDRVEWSRKLGPPEQGGKGYITRSEMDADELDWRRKEMLSEQADLALDIFLTYEFPKEAEKRCSDYLEAGRELARTRATASAELAKAEAELKSKKSGYELQKEQGDKIRRQIASCVIRATHPGMVVYNSTSVGWGSSTKIEEGAVVRERQIILTIPDPGKMGVSVRVHESMVDRVKPGMRARVVLDAFPDTPLWGRVDKVAILPDAQNPFFSPDLKVYSTTITIDTPPAFLKTGMTAQVTIYVNVLKDVLAVPIQAVTFQGGRRVCLLPGRGSRLIPRPITTGLSNDSFIQVLDGLRAGDAVILQPLSGGSSAAASVTGRLLPSGDKPPPDAKDAPAAKAGRQPRAPAATPGK